METTGIIEFLERAETTPVIDVRTPSEYSTGHIPGSVNIPLFSDSQRAEVGTLYKQKGELDAILKGLDFVGPEMSGHLRSGITVAGSNKELLVHCWRGGRRSASMSWLFEQGGINCRMLEGGYKSYRQHILEYFDKQFNIVVLGGMTGSGKTEILKHIANSGEQVVDLEGLANHRGSAFGAIGMPPQPSSEQFANLLYDELRKIDPHKRLFVEDESLNIGSVFMPENFYGKIRENRVIALISSIDVRMPRLLEEYGKMPAEDLINSINRIRKRLGGMGADEAIESVRTGDISRAVEIVLSYYDKTYRYGLSRREATMVTTIEATTHNASENAKLVIEIADSLGL